MIGSSGSTISNNKVKAVVVSLPIFVFSLILVTSHPTFAASELDPSDSILANWYEKALSVNQNNVPALVEKGTDLVIKGDGEEAITWLDKALNIDPTNLMALVGKGAALRDLGKYQEATVMYDRALAIDPSDVYAIGGKADSLYGSGQHEQAVLWIDKALELNPSDGKIQQVKESLHQAIN
ncbi:MAG: tetratricopeptide repeat protein [Nitrososphaeraceae archaeon]|nr:tetratricopeptide repeat protein [Nitrososphaeraceae archaeon]